MEQSDVDTLVTRLRDQGTDDASCEVKACGGGLGTSIWDSVSAFANTSGGLLVLGLEERSGFEPAAGFDPDRVLSQFVEGMGDGGGGGRLRAAPSYEIRRHNVGHRPVVIVVIHENGLGDKPCHVIAKGLLGGSFKRIDDRDIRLSTTEIFEMERTLTTQDSDRAIVPEADADDLDQGLVNALVRAKKDSKALRGVREMAHRLTRINLTTKAGEIRLAGLLVAGVYPQQFLPRLIIDVAVHPTNEKSAPGSAVRFIDRVLCDGPLAGAIDQAVEAVARNLRTTSLVEGVSRRAQLEIPREVLREAVANAVLHREYHELFQGQPVNIDVHPDRVVITSPGGLWGGKTIDNLDDGVSRCRNQTLVQLLQDATSPDGAGPTVEGQGGGIKLMINEMEAHALDRPRFRVTPDQVEVVLRRHGVEIPELRAWLRSLTDRDLSSPEDAALVMARREGRVSVQMLRDDLRIDSDDARDLLAELSSLGLLRADGGEAYVLWGQEPVLGRAEAVVLAALSEREPRDIHTVASLVSKTPGSLRPVLRRLVATGRVTATAPATSRLRRYLRASDPPDD